MNIEKFYTFESIEDKLFDRKVKLLSSVTELFELQLALLEYQMLNREELINQAAYFESIDNIKTKHYLFCTSSSIKKNDNRSSRTKNYFEKGKFSTGYSTHSLFPYRGKFHPQLIKSLINIIGLKKTDTILDPMCGSGTTNIEASLMGIDSIAIDLSPFCQFMTKVKYESLKINPELLVGIEKRIEDFYEFFKTDNIKSKLLKIKDIDKIKIYNLLLLAYLDSLGYSKRVKKSTHKQLFIKVVNRYLETIKHYQNKSSRYVANLGKIKIIENSSALSLHIDDNSIDGIITSPPYSFAIDYVKNDESQLNYFGYDTNEIRNNMIGLNGKNNSERLSNYFTDMDTVCSEISRVLKPDKYLVMIIGSNTKQTGGVRLEQTIIDSCSRYKLNLVKSILKPIKGMRNTMKEEYILFFRKER